MKFLRCNMSTHFFCRSLSFRQKLSFNYLGRCGEFVVLTLTLFF
jgi:hypothetical protein